MLNMAVLLLTWAWTLLIMPWFTIARMDGPVGNAENGPAFVGKAADQAEIAQGVAEQVGEGAASGKQHPTRALQEFGGRPKGIALGGVLVLLQQDEHYPKNKVAECQGENDGSYIQGCFHPCRAGNC